MTNKEKAELRQLCREGFTFKEIRGIMSCCDATIRQSLKLFKPKAKDDNTRTAA